jgi:hypothetical protein
MAEEERKQITITMTDEVYRRIRQALNVRVMSGAAYGLVDALAMKIIDAMGKGETELTLDKVKKEPT